MTSNKGEKVKKDNISNKNKRTKTKRKKNKGIKKSGFVFSISLLFQTPKIY
jgi:hypothetical protein